MVVIIPNDDIRKILTKKLHGVGIHGCNIFGIIATEAAYRYGEKWLEQLLDYLAGNLKYIIDYYFACPRSVLTEGMKRIRNALNFVR